MITSLQIILAVVGVLFIAAVIGYNLWQERKYRQEASRLFYNKREDILLGETVDIDRPESKRIATPADTGAAARNRGEHNAAGLSAPSRTIPSQPPAAPPELHIELEGPLTGAEEDGLVVPTHAESVHSVKPRPAQAAGAPHATAPSEVLKPEAGGFHPESGLDEAVEYVARVRFAQPRAPVYANLIEGLRKIGKPLRIMGKQPGGQGWESLNIYPGHALEALEFGIQLADRNGAITAAQLDRFCQLLYDFATTEGGAVSCPDKQAALQLARELDQFCMEVDVLIGLTVVAREGHPFRGEDIHRLASAAGLTLERDGTYQLRDAEGHLLFTLTNQEENPFREGGGALTTSGVTLLFDVPRVRDGLTVFDRMIGLGLEMAESLQGQLVDDNGRVVTRESLQKDRKRLADYYARMASRGIEAGSDRALRLFV